MVSCGGEKLESTKHKLSSQNSGVELVVLGIAQDAGYPQIGCTKECCKGLWNRMDLRKMVSCLGIIDHQSQKTYLLDATPDIIDQTKILSDFLNPNEFQLPKGIFLTHGHIGHYTGLMFLGKESSNAKDIPVYAMPRMKSYLERNGPWSQLVNIENIDIQAMSFDLPIELSSDLTITPIEVPHRGEYSETAGFVVEGPSKKVLFIPDIDKWKIWERDIKEEISKVDYAFLDATFYGNGEVGNRDMSLIPHPFVEESMRLFQDLPTSEKSKVHFIHLNHTNPLFNSESEAYQEVHSAHYNVAEEGQVFEL